MGSNVPATSKFRALCYVEDEHRHPHWSKVCSSSISNLTQYCLCTAADRCRLHGGLIRCWLSGPSIYPCPVPRTRAVTSTLHVMSQSSSSPWLLYAEQLLPRGHGLPLWHPEPSELGEVLIGDVGFVQEGYFHRLFNIILGVDHPANSHGVPEGFTMLEVDRSLLFRTIDNYLPPRPVYNLESIQCTIDGGIATYVYHTSDFSSDTIDD